MTEAPTCMTPGKISMGITRSILCAMTFLVSTWLFFGPISVFHHMIRCGLLGPVVLDGETPRPGLARFLGEYDVDVFPGRLAISIILWLFTLYLGCRLLRRRVRFRSGQLLFSFALLVYVTGCDNDNRAVHPVEPVKLVELIKQADRIVVSESPEQNASELFSSTSPKDIAEFGEAVAVQVPNKPFHCMCIGTTAIRLFRGGSEIARITNHHGRSVRCSLWTSDAMLKDPERWLKWFDARNIRGPRKEADEAIARQKEAEIGHARWVAAMPQSLRPLWEQAPKGRISADAALLRGPLAKEFPDTRQRLLALFRWYGSGQGPWSGYPSYEEVACELLLEYPTSDLISAAQSENLTEQQLEGAARLFGGWDFFERRPDDRQKLPASLKKKLLDRSLKSTDEDKLARARKAFSQP